MQSKPLIMIITWVIFLSFRIGLKIRQSDLALRWAFWLDRCVQLFARSVPRRLLSNPYYHSYSTSWTKYQMRELSLTFARSKWMMTTLESFESSQMLIDNSISSPPEIIQKTGWIMQSEIDSWNGRLSIIRLRGNSLIPCHAMFGSGISICRTKFRFPNNFPNYIL